MNKEENIQKIQDQIDKVKEYLEYGMPYSEYLDLQLAFDDIVNLIQKQEKIIDKMAEQLEKCKNEIDGLSEGNIDCFIPKEFSDIDDCIKKPTCKECMKEYFKKELEKC